MNNESDLLYENISINDNLKNSELFEINGMCQNPKKNLDSKSGNNLINFFSDFDEYNDKIN